jgi:hypothetical protein
MATARYNAWARSVIDQGGTVAVPPTGADGYNPNTGTRLVPRVLSARYPMQVWVPKVNARAWPAPSEYSTTGQLGYYHAPADVQADARKFGTATSSESAVKAGEKELLNRWDVPDWLRSPAEFFGSLSSSIKWLVALALLLLVLYVLVTTRSARP